MLQNTGHIHLFTRVTLATYHKTTKLRISAGGILHVPPAGEHVSLPSTPTLHLHPVQVPLGVGVRIVMANGNGCDSPHARGEGHLKDVLLSLLKVVCGRAQWEEGGATALTMYLRKGVDDSDVKTVYLVHQFCMRYYC